MAMRHLRLATGPRDPDRSLTVVSDFVTGVYGIPKDAQRAAKLQLIAAGRFPDYPVATLDLGDGDWEVLFTIRPLAPGASFLADGTRVGTTISG